MIRKATVPKNADAIKVIHDVQRQPRYELVMKPPLYITLISFTVPPPLLFQEMDILTLWAQE